MTNTLGNNDQYCWFSVKSSNIIRDLTRPSGPLGHEDMVHYITSSLVIDKYFFKIYLKMLTNVLKYTHRSTVSTDGLHSKFIIEQ